MRMAIAALFAAAILQNSLPMRSLDQGQESRVDVAKQVTARTVDEWDALWKQHGSGRARPSVDFSKEVVAAVFLGSRPSAGFNVQIIGARQDGTALVVSYKETRPAPDALTAQVITSPYHIVAISKGSTTDVKFERVS